MSRLNLHVYPSVMRNESRLFRIATSVSKHNLFASTHLVGTAAHALPDREPVCDGVEIVRLHGASALPGPAGKLLRAVRWQLAVLRAYQHRSVGVVNAHSVWMLPLCWILALRTGASLFYNPHELETRTPTMRGMKKLAAQVIERAIIGRVQSVTVVNSSIARWYSERYRIPTPLPVRNIPVFTAEKAHLRDSIGVDGQAMVVIHTGRLARGRNIEKILDVFEELGCCHVVFLGDGPLGDHVRERAGRSDYVHWLAPVPPDRVVSHVREADVALCLIDTASLSYRYSSPNKLFEALAAGTPPLCTDLVEARRLLGRQADHWILADVEEELAPVVAGLNAGDVARFRETWTGLPSWEDEVAPLLARYRQVAEDSM